MSYCVNCGVELAPSEKKCPLCGTTVINPTKPWVEPEHRPFPQRVEYVLTRSQRRFVAGVVSLMLLVPILVCLIGNYFSTGSITWAFYVVGGCLCAFVYVLLPMIIDGFHPLWCVLLDTLVTALYLAAIAYGSGDFSWFLPLSLPLCIAAGVFMTLNVLVFTADMTALHRAASLVALTGALVVAIEVTINRYTGAVPVIRWSLYAFAPCVIISVIFILFERRQRLKDQIKRRVFH